MNKKAMALEIVLIFSAVMGMVGLFLLKATKSNNGQLETSMDQLQSYFVARAGVEHAMLKIKFLNRELYDAICMSQGRSPLFDYRNLNTTQPWMNISAANPGPIFLYKKGEYSPTGVYTILPQNSRYDIWVKVFKEDIKSNYSRSPNNNSLNMNPLSNNIKNVMGSVNSGFHAIYELTNLDFGAFEVTGKTFGANRYSENTIAVNFTIKSTYISTKNKSFDYEISRTVAVSRDNER